LNSSHPLSTGPFATGFFRFVRTGRLTGLMALACLLGVGGVSPARADVSRIREKALELEQKLNKSRYEAEVRGDTPNTLRVYKDFAFLLKESKVKEVQGEKGDPYAPRLGLYITEEAVGLDLATYIDDLMKGEMTMTADLDGVELTLDQFRVKLATAADDAERRKVYTAMKPLIEHNNVFRNSIAARTVEAYQPWGYADFAAFVAVRDGIDLDATVELARKFLADSQVMYDGLFEEIAQKYLGTEARRAKFADLDYLLEATPFQAAFAADTRNARVGNIFSGLGVKLDGIAGLRWDVATRTGKTLRGGAYALAVPAEVKVGSLPFGTPRDDDRALFNLGTAMCYTQSKQTQFETAYLLNEAATAALDYVIRGIRDEPAWLQANSELTAEQLPEYRKFQAFNRLLEARMLAAAVAYEVPLYRGATDAEEQFKEIMREATGIRLSSTDAKRSLEFADGLQSASRFLGLLASGALRARLIADHGADWYADGKAASEFSDWWKQGGGLTLDALQNGGGDSGALIATISHIQGE